MSNGSTKLEDKLPLKHSNEGKEPQSSTEKKLKYNHEETQKIGSLNVNSNEKNVLMWFRTDLRVEDNRALEAAILCVKKHRDSKIKSNLFALFLASPGEWKNHDCSPIKVNFFLRNVQKLSDKLGSFNVPFIYKTADTPSLIPEVINKVCQDHNIKDLFYNIEYEINESKRDAKVTKLLEKNGTRVVARHDLCGIFPGEIVAKSTQKPYSVYTPFKNTWLQIASNDVSHLKQSSSIPEIQKLDETLKTQYPELFSLEIPPIFSGFEMDNELLETALKLYPAGEEASHSRLDQFSQTKIKQYKEDRDFPSKPGTSILSPYLTAGVISVRQCLAKAKSSNSGKLWNGNKGIDTWIQELIWRDFYKHVLVAFPHVCKNQPFKPEGAQVEWSVDESLFEAWCEGRTGYPIVDAGMRQLKSIGWMHNRVRMVTAMFLSKDLLIDWRKGERYFMQNLVDGDLASNNGGWQWSASTGTDAQPYFRVFNPTLQSERFDKSGDYIRKWVPELANVRDTKAIHDPYSNLPPTQFSKLGYPKPVVDHTKARLKAIAVFEKAMKRPK